jgi:hypothetical protein
MWRWSLEEERGGELGVRNSTEFDEKSEKTGRIVAGGWRNRVVLFNLERARSDCNSGGAAGGLLGAMKGLRGGGSLVWGTDVDGGGTEWGRTLGEGRWGDEGGSDGRREGARASGRPP